MPASKTRQRPRLGGFADGELLRWWVGKNDAGSVHIVPTLDTYPHELSGACPCGVHCEGDDPSEFRWVHDSFDGREDHEAYGRAKQ